MSRYVQENKTQAETRRCRSGNIVIVEKHDCQPVFLGWRFYNNFENLEILDLSYNRISEFQVQYFDDGWRKRWDKLPQTVKELNLRGRYYECWDKLPQELNLRGRY